jgi:hypothetical protein
MKDFSWLHSQVILIDAYAGYVALHWYHGNKQINHGNALIHSLCYYTTMPMPLSMSGINQCHCLCCSVEHRSHSGGCPLVTGTIRKKSPSPVNSVNVSTSSSLSLSTSSKLSSSSDGSTSFDRIRRRRLAKRPARAPPTTTTSDDIQNMYVREYPINFRVFLNENDCLMGNHSAKRARVDGLRCCFTRDLLLSTLVLPIHDEPPATADIKTFIQSLRSSPLPSSLSSSPLTVSVTPATGHSGTGTGTDGLSLIVQP